jgi:hypothetical protein
VSAAPPDYFKLEDLGRVRLSRNFFMRDFLYSETANFFQLQNIPDNPELAIDVGRHLCEEILEPLQDAFGRIHIRSAFRSETVNRACREHGLNCAPNEKARGVHIWDSPDENGAKGAMACIVVPWLIDRCQAGLDWREMAWWIHDRLNYSAAIFYRPLLAFNISWSETPRRVLVNRIDEPNAVLAPPGERGSAVLAEAYACLARRTAR